MFQYNFKIALRNIKRFPTYGIINIVGLSVGIMASFLIYLYIDHETSFDAFYPENDQVFRLAVEYNIGGQEDTYCNVGRPMAPAFKEEYPEVASFTRMRGLNGLNTHKGTIRYQENYIETNQAFIVDSTFFDVFDQPILTGDKNNALRSPYSIALSQSLSKKIFGAVDPIGQRLELTNRPERFTVTAVFEDVPSNTHMPYDMLISWNKYFPDEVNEIWYGAHVYSYIKLNEGTSSEAIAARFPTFFEKYMSTTFDELEGSASVILQPLTSIHLTSHLTWEAYPNGNASTIQIFSAVGIFLLLIAIINYVNLTTARSATRAKEVGVRKTIGAQRQSLTWQFLSESVFIAFCAFFIAGVAGSLIAPYLESLLNFEIYSIFSKPTSILQLLSLSLLVGLLSGLYPAVVLSSYKASEVLKGKFTQSSKGGDLRKSLVVVQLTTSIFVIIGTILVMNQVTFLKNKDLGYNKENVYVAHVKDTALTNNIKPLINELSRLPQVGSVSSVIGLPHEELNRTIVSPETSTGEFGQKGSQFYIIDNNTLDLLDIKVLKGEKFSGNSQTEADKVVIINEAASRKFGWSDNPIGKRIKYGPNDEGEVAYRRVVAVVNDFHMGSLEFNLEPVVMYPTTLDDGAGEYLLIKLLPGNLETSTRQVQAVVAGFNPKVTTDYKFLDDDFDMLYNGETNLTALLGYFSIIVILISSLGLLGLISFTAIQKSKEVAVRKVLGASISSLVFSLSKSFIVLTLISNVLAWPMVYWVMNQWLQNFAYHINLGISQFLLAGAVSLLIVMVTIVRHALKTALAQPAISLKDE